MSSQNQDPEFTFNPHTTIMYDVYISFEPHYPSHPFISLLSGALKRAGVHLFLDNYMKPKSKDLILSSVIKGSRVSIVVFTTDFACTTWSLKELEKIMEYRSSRGQQVVPVFYEVDPEEVFNQTGHFGEALLATLARTSTNQAKVLSYRTALKEAAAISPRFLTNFR
nr:disease resistance protein RLM3-like [Arachis hypogaea]